MIYCDCGASLMERVDSKKFEVLKFHNVQQSKTTIEYFGDKFEVECKKCRHRFTFTKDKITGTIRKGLTYVLARPKIKNR